MQGYAERKLHLLHDIIEASHAFHKRAERLERLASLQSQQACLTCQLRDRLMLLVHPLRPLGECRQSLESGKVQHRSPASASAQRALPARTGA